MTTEGLFGSVTTFPDETASRRFGDLVGVDEIKRRLLSEAVALLDPSRVESWSTREHHRILPAVREVVDRSPLFVLAGDVGTGKTELAETVGEPIARRLGIPVTLYPLTLSARGHGAVGEMTSLLTSAFEAVVESGRPGRGRDGKLRHAIILLIDEADALAQSRELAQMHHEDRAGVNALIRGIDSIRKERIPALAVMCTNRLGALDPAVRRRAAATFEFARPDAAARRELLCRSFAGAGIPESDLAEVVRLTGPLECQEFGCTFSDLRQRFVPTAVMDAMEVGTPISGSRLVELARRFRPTPPFQSRREALE